MKKAKIAPEAIFLFLATLGGTAFSYQRGVFFFFEGEWVVMCTHPLPFRPSEFGL